MNTLERRCRLLLRAYPAAYREIRGEEIINTLLEATLPGRSWPLPRDSCGLILGGLRARAALNRQLTTAANLRVALLAGVAACLVYSAVSSVIIYVVAEVSAHGLQQGPFEWQIVLAAVLTLLAVSLAFLTSKRGMVLAAALPVAAIACYAGPWGPGIFGAVAFRLVLLAALVALVPQPARSARLSRRWLVLIGVLAVFPAIPAAETPYGPFLYEVPLLAIAAISIGWAAIDARPAIAVIVYFLGFYLPIAADELTMGAIPVVVVIVLPYLVGLTVIGVAAVWVLRRQSARPGRPTRI
jgi:hypothetical protein